MDIIRKYIDKLLSELSKNYIETVRYVLISVGLFSVITNLFSGLSQNAKLYYYLFYVIFLFIVILFLMKFRSNIIIGLLITIIGVVSIIDNDVPNNINIGLYLTLIGIDISGSSIFSILATITIVFAVISNHIFKGINPSDSLNVILAYLAIIFIDYIKCRNLKEHRGRNG